VPRLTVLEWYISPKVGLGISPIVSLILLRIKALYFRKNISEYCKFNFYTYIFPRDFLPEKKKELRAKILELEQLRKETDLEIFQ